MSCERCAKLEELTFALWSSIFPKERWLDAETALAYLRVEYKSVMEDAHAKLDALSDVVSEVESRTRRELSELAATMLPVLQLVSKSCIDQIPKRAGTVRIVFRNPMEVLRVRDAIAISLTDERVKELVYKGEREAEVTADAYACALSWLMFDKAVSPVFEENLGIIDKALKYVGYELRTEEPE